MSNKITIKAETREDISKSATRQLRLANQVPGIVYGKSGSVSIVLNAKDLPAAHTASATVALELGGKSIEVLMREVQIDPLSGKPIHIDFQEIQANRIVTVPVRLDFVGITKEQQKDALFRAIRRSISLRGPVGQAPDKIQVDVSSLKVDETLHLDPALVPAGFEVREKNRKPAVAQLTRIK
jgi:large subunit ribosomal protein L25